MKHIGVTGGRYYNKKRSVTEALDGAVYEHGSVTLHVGDATGADALARSWAFSRDIPVIVYYADWQAHGKAAGPIRNRQMVENIDVLYAFPGGRGTADCTRAARELGVDIWILR